MRETGTTKRPERREASGVVDAAQPAVLYVTDEPKASTTTDLETIHGFDVSAASSPEAGSTGLPPGPFDCAVLEPGGDRDGLALLEAVTRQYSALPVLVYADPEEGTPSAAYLHAGAADYLSKATDTDRRTLLAHRIAQCHERAADDSQRALETTQQLYRAFVDTAPDAIFVADGDTGEIVEANAAAAELLGRPTADIVGMHQSELHPADERPRYRALFDHHLAAGEGLFSTFEDDPIYVVRADGERVPVEINAKKIELGDRTLFQGHFRDVSRRCDRERKLQAILQESPDVAIVYSADGEYKDILTGREDLLVSAPEALKGKNVHDVLPLAVADRILVTIRETIETHDTRELEYQLALHGETRWFEARTAPLVSEIYDDDCALFLARDITSHKRRERELRGFREAVEQAGHAVLITGTDGAIEYVNPAFEQISGYSTTEAIGKRPSLLKSGVHDDQFYQQLWQTILRGEVWEGEIINERRDGERYHIKQTIAPIVDESGEIERFVAVNIDITDRKEHERQLERERDRLDEFATTVAHDLRSPLSIAYGHIELAEQGEAGASLETARDALERMDAMIAEVLTLSKQGKSVREPEPVRFRDVVQSAWRHVETSTATLQLAEEVAGWSMEADPSRLRELLENLFKNAAQHGGPGVTVRVERLAADEGFAVEDDGPGIQPNERSRVFESGFTTAEDGTGFGLPIVKQIVEAHGWRVRVTSGATGGARFEIVTGAHPTEP